MKLNRRQFIGMIGIGLSGSIARKYSVVEPKENKSVQNPANQQNERLETIVRFQHPEKLLFFAPQMSEAAIAAVFGVELENYREVKNRITSETHRAAEELLADAEFAKRVDRLPFKEGATIVGIGESTMDDLQSWLEILRNILDLRRPQDRIRVVNNGVSAQTTTTALRRFTATMWQKPDWIFCSLGGNDAARSGFEATKTNVSLDETAKNLAEMRRLAAQESQAKWIWLTLPPIDEERIKAYAPFKMGRVVWRSPDIEGVNEFLRRQSETVIDLTEPFGRPPRTTFLMPDGLHVSLAGHKATVKTLIEKLTA